MVAVPEAMLVCFYWDILVLIVSTYGGQSFSH